MLPVPELDDQSYEDILDEAMNTVVSIFPEWTDFNAHDPGITILELFALMKESTQFYLDQIGEENREKYRKLVGIRRRSKQPATTLVSFETDEEKELLVGHKLNAGGICFETTERVWLVRNSLASCLAVRDEGILDILTEGQMEFGGAVRFLAFGDDPQPGDICYIGLEDYLPFGDRLQFFFKLEDDYGVKRNPIGDFPFSAGLAITWQYYTTRGWMDMDIIRRG